MRNLEAGVSNFASFLTEDRTQEPLFWGEFGFTFWRDFSDEDVTRANLGTDADNSTVIEVGVDVPEASLMVIENAERLGLSQLHQLRGRVGRGDRQSVCLLMYQAPLGNMAKERLATMRQTTDGFAIAQKDLELRGPGELLGTRQSGAPQFRIADLARDRALLPAVQYTADKLLRDHPDSAAPLVARWVRAGLAFSHA